MVPRNINTRYQVQSMVYDIQLKALVSSPPRTQQKSMYRSRFSFLIVSFYVSCEFTSFRFRFGFVCFFFVSRMISYIVSVSVASRFFFIHVVASICFGSVPFGLVSVFVSFRFFFPVLFSVLFFPFRFCSSRFRLMFGSCERKFIGFFSCFFFFFVFALFSFRSRFGLLFVSLRFGLSRWCSPIRLRSFCPKRPVW